MFRYFLLGTFALLPLSARAQDFVSIPQIQGKTDVSPLLGQTVRTSGVVTAVFPGLNGFYLQDPQGDGDAATSDAAFVYRSARSQVPQTEVKVGQRVTVEGHVEEFGKQTQLGRVASVKIDGEGAPIAPITLTLPLDSAAREAFEGMLVRIPGTLTVTDQHDLKRFGSIGLSSGGRLFVPTNTDAKTPDNSEARLIVLDDASGAQNPPDAPYMDENGTRRAGDTTQNLTGILGFVFSQYRLEPTVPPVFTSGNPRPERAPDVGGNLKIGSANLHNYWTTFKNAQNPNARGATGPASFGRQTAKIVAELKGLDADVFGFLELENNGDGAIDDVVTRLNAAYGAPVYAKVPAPATGFGGDAIRVGLIYKPARLELVGASQSATDAIFERRPVAQTFRDTQSGGVFTLMVNHWKSKGSPPDSGDIDAGQGAWNLKRVKQAKAALAFAQQLQTTSGDPDVLMLGDLNAYVEEDPLRVVRDGGLKHLNLRLKPEERYSFGYDGRFGSLDHALATPSLDAQVTGFEEWHINADEPFFLAPEVADARSDASPFRASDHDPFLVGLQLKSDAVKPVVAATKPVTAPVKAKTVALKTKPVVFKTKTQSKTAPKKVKAAAKIRAKK